MRLVSLSRPSSGKETGKRYEDWFPTTPPGLRPNTFFSLSLSFRLSFSVRLSFSLPNSRLLRVAGDLILLKTQNARVRRMTLKENNTEGMKRNVELCERLVCYSLCI